MKEIKSICYLLNQYFIFNNIDINHQIYVVFAFTRSANYYFQLSNIKSMELTDISMLKTKWMKKFQRNNKTLQETQQWNGMFSAQKLCRI